MPAITQLLWLVWAMRITCQESAVPAPDEKMPSESQSSGVMAGRILGAGWTLAAAVLSVACLRTATMPELLCRTSLQAGDFEWGRRQLEAARARFLAAALADPWSIEPVERLAELAFQRWRATGQEQDFDEAVKRWEEVSRLLPFASRPYRKLGQVWLSRFDSSHSNDHAKRAAEGFASAVERYPHHAGLLSEWAIACDGAGLSEKARNAARRAIRQDDTNQQAGHTDKFLSAEVRARMERLAG